MTPCLKILEKNILAIGALRCKSCCGCKVIDRSQSRPGSLAICWYGEFVPRDKNTAEIITADLIQKYNSTPQQKSRNRRVEITFLAPNEL